MSRIAANPAVGTGRARRRGDRATSRVAARPCGWLAAVLLLAGAGCGMALEPSTPLAGFARQAWAMENGLPQNTVQALAQTRDGFMWLGTEVGLVRFDGNGFQVFDRSSTPALPGDDVRCLLAADDGALWIGTSEGLAQWKDGRMTAFTTKDGLPADGILELRQLELGGLGVWTSQGPAVRVGDRFAQAANADSWPRSAIRSGEATGQMQFEAALPSGVYAMGDRESIGLYKSKSAVAPTARLRVSHELPGTRIQTVFPDREGSLWIGTNGGLARWIAGQAQLLPVTDPLARASILSLMEDREGNLWVGTEADGLHILRDQRFRTFGAREGLSQDAATTVVEDKAGMLWVGTSGGGLDALQRTDAGIKVARTYGVRDGLASDVILSLAAAANGDLWVGTPDGLSRVRGGGIETFTSADGLPDDFIRSLLADADGSLWIGTRRGLTHWTGTMATPHLETFTAANGLGSDLVGAVQRDAAGSLWVATFAGLSRLGSGKIDNFTTADGLSSNVITALLPRANGGLLIGTQDHGWNLWDGRQFLKGWAEGEDQTAIHAMLSDGGGHLWFATGSGISRCDAGEQAGGAKAAACTRWIDFGSADGLRSRETATNSHPSAWRSRDGNLWFATPRGVVEVDPAHFPVNAVPPPVAIERFSVDDADQALRAAGPWERVPAGHVHFQFDYAGLSFTAPQKVRYRYMLEGFDHGWTEAGVRRTAYYTAIPPGHYTFRVQAANNDGLWNTEGASLRFELRPHFYQTLWFYALLLAAAAAMVLLLLRRRLHRAEREFQAVLGERNRIAREIHDTLAQGYVGISVQLELVAELLRLNKTEAAARHLDATRSTVREGLAEARQSIWALRSQDAGETTLPVRLRRMAEAAGGRGCACGFSLFGAYRALPGDAEREILRVAQEALHNVNKHAAAKNIFVQLEYGAGGIALEVRDDGRGFAAAAQSAAGHYGLTGMRERAAAIGGTLEVTSEPGVGTTVRLEMPAPREEKESH